MRAAFATSPLRLLTPRNHGNAAWVFLSSFGGGLVDGDQIDVRVDVGSGASALLGTQSATKVYRSAGGGVGPGPVERSSPDSLTSRGGCSHHLTASVGDDASLTLIPDPVVCFADARYEQTIDASLAPSASLLALDGYTSGRSARGERWAFAGYSSRTIITRGGESPAVAPRSIVDATRLDPRHGAIAERMGRFDAVLSLLAVGPRFAAVRDAMLATVAPLAPEARGDSVLVAASPLGDDACIVRVAAERFELASLTLRSSFTLLARVLGDDPFARKW